MAAQFRQQPPLPPPHKYACSRSRSCNADVPPQHQEQAAAHDPQVENERPRCQQDGDDEVQRLEVREVGEDARPPVPGAVGPAEGNEQNGTEWGMSGVGGGGAGETGRHASDVKAGRQAGRQARGCG